MSLVPADRISTFLETYGQAYPGQDAPVVTYMDGWYRIKEKGQRAGKMRAEDLDERRRDLAAVIEGREFDLETISGIAAASDQAHHAAQAYLKNHLRARIESCDSQESLRALKSEIGMQCLSKDGFLVPIPTEIDMAFFTRSSLLNGRETA